MGIFIKLLIKGKWMKKEKNFFFEMRDTFGDLDLKLYFRIIFKFDLT